MRRLGFVGVVVACSMAAPASAAERTLSVDEEGTLLTMRSAHIESKGSRRTLVLEVEPASKLGQKTEQAAAEDLFEHYLMGSAQRWGIGRATIVMGSYRAAKTGIAEPLSFRFVNDGGTKWSLRGRAPTDVEKPYLKPETIKLADGTPLAVERLRVLTARDAGRLETIVRAELLFDGANPMLERSVIYVRMAAYWQEHLRKLAEAEGATKAEIAAAFEPRSRRFQVRDVLELRVARTERGWPGLPAIDTDAASLKARDSEGKLAAVRFGIANASEMDFILTELIGETSKLTPAGLTSAHR